jgi:uncharacterized protein
VIAVPALPTVGRAESALVVAATVAIGLGGALPKMSAVVTAAAAVMVFGGLLLAAALLDYTLARPLALYGVLAGLLTLVAPEGTWPLPAVIALGVVLATAPHQRRSWLGRGTPDRLSWLLTCITAAAAPVALAAWFVTAGSSSPSVAAAVGLLREIPGWALPLVAIAFATLNAFAEELLFRGIVQGALHRVMAPMPAIVLQGIAFGAIHLYGFPSGTTGVVLASGYGVALGVIRWRSGGLLAPWLTHVIADLAIVAMVVAFLL